MSPYSRRTGKRYAAGSSQAYGGWEPRRCAYGERCLHGGKIVKSRDWALQFELNTETGMARSWHIDCRRALGPLASRLPLPAHDERNA